LNRLIPWLGRGDIGGAAVPDLSAPPIGELLEEVSPLMLALCPYLNFHRALLFANDDVDCPIAMLRLFPAIFHCMARPLTQELLDEVILAQPP